MLYYFGTSQKDYGHYFWKCEGARMIKERYLEDPRLPFNPEYLVEPSQPPYLRNPPPRPINGDVFYFNIEGWSVLYISGSCIDGRPGCKSVFYTKQNLSKKEMVVEVLKSDAAWNLIDAMSFRERIILKLQTL